MLSKSLQSVLVFCAPFLAPVMVAYAVYFGLTLLYPPDPLLVKALSANDFDEKNKGPLCIFRGFAYIVVKPVAKGEPLSISNLERVPYVGKRDAVPTIKYLDEGVSDRRVKNALEAGSILTDSDLIAKNDASAKKEGGNAPAAEDRDSKIRSSDDRMGKSVTGVLLGSQIIFEILGFALIAVGTIWLVVVALKTSLAWGVAVLLLPHVGPALYSARHWATSRTPYLVWLVGCLSAALALGGFCTLGQRPEIALQALFAHQVLLDRLTKLNSGGAR